MEWLVNSATCPSIRRDLPVAAEEEAAGKSTRRIARRSATTTNLDRVMTGSTSMTFSPWPMPETHWHKKHWRRWRAPLVGACGCLSPDLRQKKSWLSANLPANGRDSLRLLKKKCQQDFWLGSLRAFALVTETWRA